jgi:phosphomannomutase
MTQEFTYWQKAVGFAVGGFLVLISMLTPVWAVLSLIDEYHNPYTRLGYLLQREFGPHYYGRRDLHIPDEMKQSAIQRASSEHTQCLGKYRVLKKENMDGMKFFLDAPTNGNGAEAWALFRASGTEHLLRLYTEAASKELVNELLAAGEQFVRNRA